MNKMVGMEIKKNFILKKVAYRFQQMLKKSIKLSAGWLPCATFFKINHKLFINNFVLEVFVNVSRANKLS